MRVDEMCEDVLKSISMRVDEMCKGGGPEFNSGLIGSVFCAQQVRARKAVQPSRQTCAVGHVSHCLAHTHARVCPRTVRMLGNHVPQASFPHCAPSRRRDGLWPMMRRVAVSRPTDLDT
eukprot:293616-Prymnesium_polylepis.1